MNITKQLILTLSIALLALLLLGVGGAIQLQRAQERFDTVQNRIIPSIQGLNAAKGFLADSRLAGYRLSVFSNLADKTALDKAVADANTNFDKVIATYRAERLYDATDSKMLDADQAAMEAYRRALVIGTAACRRLQLGPADLWPSAWRSVVLMLLAAARSSEALTRSRVCSILPRPPLMVR